MKHIALLKYLCIIAIYCSVPWPIMAGYRNVDDAGSIDQDAGDRIGPSEGEGKLAPSPRGGRLTMVLVRSNGVEELTNRSGNFAIQPARPLETMTLRFRKPELTAGASVFVYVVHGGRVNGKLADSVVVDKDGSFDVVFQAGPHSGNYPVGVRYGGADEVVEFWVGEQPTDSRRDDVRMQEESR